MVKEDHHNYEYEINLKGSSAPARIIRMVGKDNRVLEIGAGPGSVTKHLQATGNCKVVALEIDESAIVLLKPYCEKVYRADLNDASWPDLLGEDGKFDVVVAGDVLEHVYDPWATLEAMKGLINEDGYIIVSLPHVGHSAVAACLLDENFDYTDIGLLDQSHIRFFGLKNMQALFNDAGLHIVDVEFVIIPPELTELSKRWKCLSSNMRKALSSSKYGNVYQVVIKAVPATRTNENIDLMRLPVEAPPSFISIYTRKIANKIIPEKYHSKALEIAQKLGFDT